MIIKIIIAVLIIILFILFYKAVLNIATWFKPRHDKLKRIMFTCITFSIFLFIVFSVGILFHILFVELGVLKWIQQLFQ